MTDWRSDERLPFALAALLGMIAGVAAKQAVALSSGYYPKPFAILADFLVLGMIWFMVMYVHSKFPSVTIEGIALLSAALAMWGPKGIVAILNRFKLVTLTAAEQAARNLLLHPIEPVHRPTVSETVGLERERATDDEQSNDFGMKAPIRKLRDIIPVESVTPADQASLLGQIGRATPDYQPPKNGGKNAKDG